jgi:hypothetical protein
MGAARKQIGFRKLGKGNPAVELVPGDHLNTAVIELAPCLSPGHHTKTAAPGPDIRRTSGIPPGYRVSFGDRLPGENGHGITSIEVASVARRYSAAAFSVADRQEIIRQLVDEVVVHAQGKTEVVDVTIHGIGGCAITNGHRPVLRIHAD